MGENESKRVGKRTAMGFVFRSAASRARRMPVIASTRPPRPTATVTTGNLSEQHPNLAVAAGACGLTDAHGELLGWLCGGRVERGQREHLELRILQQVRVAETTKQYLRDTVGIMLRWGGGAGRTRAVSSA